MDPTQLGSCLTLACQGLYSLHRSHPKSVMHLAFNPKFRCTVNSFLSSWNEASCPVISGPTAVYMALSGHQHQFPVLARTTPPLPLLDFLGFGWIWELCEAPKLCWQHLDCFASANERESKCFGRFTAVGIRWHTNLKLTMTVFMQSLEKPTQIIWELKMNVSEHFHSHRTILASC